MSKFSSINQITLRQIPLRPLQLIVGAALLLCSLFPHYCTAAISSVSPFVAQLKPGERLNLNTATESALEQLPGIGPAFARRIVEYRRKHGPFKRPQDIIAVRGMSARRYRQLAPFIRI